MSTYKKHRNKKRGSAGRKRRTGIYAVIIVAFVGTILSIQMAKLYKKKQATEAEEAALIKEKEEQEARYKELIRYEEYTKTDEYVEDTAFEKLGMIKDNWIIFREKH